MNHQEIEKKMLAALESARFYLLQFRLEDLPSIELKGRQSIRSLPDESAVYVLADESGVVYYVGKANNLKSRWNSHAIMKRAIEREDLRLFYWGIPIGFLASVESFLITQLRPLWNQSGICAEGDYLPRLSSRRFDNLWPD